jgi:hypothetical protein
VSVPDTPIWHRQPDETAKAYAAFEVYLTLGADRSIDKAFQKSQRDTDGKTAAATAPRHWEKWSSDFSWTDRARAYDQHLAQRLHETFEADLIARRQQVLRSELRDADALLKLWMRRMRDAELYDVKTLVSMGRWRMTISDLERRALGMPTSQTDITTKGEKIQNGMAVDDMVDLLKMVQQHKGEVDAGSSTDNPN